VDNTFNHFCAIRVKDSGIGIPEKNRNIIFDAFRQLSEGVTRRYEGTGLGLTIAQKMILLLDGKLEVLSNIGEGSTFSVLLPMPVNQIVQEIIPETEAVSESKEAALSSNKPNILIVEDYLMNVDIMKYFLNDIAKMNSTTNYEETMIAIANDQYDLILMDINLKDSIGGIELMKELRKLDSYKQTPIIAITGYTSSIDQDTFMKEGFSGFLAKPFNQKQLRSIITNHLG
jgi:CheY-like chemotaxis protein